MLVGESDVAVEVNPDVFVVVVVISEVIVAVTRASQTPVLGASFLVVVDIESIDASEGISALIIW